MPAELMTMTAYARSRDLSPSTITRQVRDGLIPVHGERRLIDPEEADRIRAQNLHPGLRKGSLANADPPAEQPDGRHDDRGGLYPPGWQKGDDPFDALEIHGVQGRMMPVEEHYRINALILRLVLETLREDGMMDRILKRVREVVSEELERELAKVQRALDEAEEATA